MKYYSSKVSDLIQMNITKLSMGKQGAFDLIFEQYYLIQDYKAYILTLTCEIDEFALY